MPVDFTKVRMIQHDDYEDCRKHTCAKCGNECNLSMMEMNDELIVSGSTDRTLRVWHAATGECRNVFYGHFVF